MIPNARQTWELRTRQIVLRLFGHPYLRRLQWPVLRRLLGVRQEQTLLDVGTGAMAYAIALRKQADPRVVAIDLVFRQADIMRARRYGVEPIVADACVLPLPDSTIDYILASSLVQMVPEPLRLLRECLRVLRPGGHMVLSVPNRYQFLPRLMKFFPRCILTHLFRLPPTDEELINHLNTRFSVAGPQGYYSSDEIATLLTSAGFRVIDHEYSPGRFGSLLWELAVLGYVRFGNVAFHVLFLAYPFARLFDMIAKPTTGSEHIIRIVPIDEH